jgi:hypothetical protein
MKRAVLCFAFLPVLAVILVSGAFAGGITQDSVTVSVPKDYRDAQPYKAEFVVPEACKAFNFTVWTDKAWGIVDISGGGYRELYSSRNTGTSTDAPIGDAESSENVGGPPSGDDPVDPLSRLTLGPGTYIVWTEGSPGSTITLQYLVQPVR